MKKIAIISCYGNYNYGNKLQNYAVQEIYKKIGLDPYTIEHYGDSNSIKNYGLFKSLYKRLKKIIERILKKNDCADSPEKQQRYKNFLDFDNLLQKEAVIIKNNKVPREISDKYDIFSVGSDQVWNPRYGGCSPLYMLEFTEKRKISFAASFGVESIPKEFFSTFKKGLDRFQYISLRENKGYEIVKEITGRTDAKVILDPTMLLDSCEWDMIIKKPTQLVDDRYVLCYFLGEVSDEIMKKIDDFANINKCKVINILDKNSEFYTCGPSEFVYLEKNAFAIFTDSFHSSVFAILYKRPLQIFKRNDNNKNDMFSRLETLIKKFELKNVIYDGKIDKRFLNIDYSNVDNILDKERREAIKFLEIATE